MSIFTSELFQTNLFYLSIGLHHTTHTLRHTCTFSLCLQTLTGADEPQSMIVMSYRSPWENRGTERGEEGRGNQRTHTQTEGGGLPERKTLRWTKWRQATQDRVSILGLIKSLSPIVLLKIEFMGKHFLSFAGLRELFNSEQLLDRLLCSGWPCRHACHDRVQMPLNGTDAVSLFSSFCAVCMEWRQTALGKGEVRFVCVCVVCVGWRFR